MFKTLLCLALLVPLDHALALQGGRSLRWSAVDVTAHLDSAGRLSVQERQTIVLSGAWNGPERTFAVANGQTLFLRRLTRLDNATGASRELTEGDLSNVDYYGWAEGNTLRWRSRAPSDRVYSNDTLIYTIEYGYEGILLPSPAADGTGATEFVLDHDFAFGDRYEDIERFSLRLTLDPAWVPPAGFRGEYSAGPLHPGNGYVVTLPMRFALAGRPGGVVFGADANVRSNMLVLVLFVSFLLFIRFIVREIRLGKFAPVPRPSDVTREWLDQHVFSLAPEVAGTAWDDTTSAPEVAATLARLVADRKLESEVKSKKAFFGKTDVLHLRLLVPRESLTGHDHALIDALFERGSERTSTTKVRERYKSSGFDPAKLISPSIRQLVDSGPETGRALKAPSPKMTMLLLATAVVVFALAATRHSSDMAVAAFAFKATLWYIFVAIQSRLWQDRVVNPALHLFRVLIPLGLGSHYFGLMLTDPAYRVSALALVAVSLWVLALVNSTFNIASSRHDSQRIALRKRLAAARQYFQRELRKPSPALLDAWFPWIIGFGLGRHIDRWFRAFSGETRDSFVPHHTTSSSGSSAGGGWSGFGGGGGFAGGGSSASFAAAVGGMAASVSAPSDSSSGGGGGGGGGGSSGGGGGGGW